LGIVPEVIDPGPRSKSFEMTGGWRVDTGSIRLSLRLGRSAESADIARRAVRAALGRNTSMELVDDAVLCTSEIVTNAIVHTNCGCELQMSFDPAGGGNVRVEVSDDSPHRPLRANPVDVHRVGGRGLQIVEETSTRWGSHPMSGGGKVVWFELSKTGFHGAVQLPV
jgi:anti-sigma regulatory factor (Ser/Thr protein kinase)